MRTEQITPTQSNTRAEIEPTQAIRPRARAAKQLTVMLASLLALGFVTASSAQATHGKLANVTSYPSSYVNCSGSQIDYLKGAFRRAHHQVDGATQVIDYIASRPAADRAELWSRDMDSGEVPSPRRYFGAYNAGRFATVRLALHEAQRRFMGQGEFKRGAVKRIKRIRCRTACAANPSAYHAPRGYIATCQKFWKRVSDAKGSDAGQARAAFTLAHEVFHWLRTDTGRYVTDMHGGSTNPYYGLADVTDLAEHHTKWANHNNDSYAFFGRAVDQVHQPRFAGVFTDKESPSTGALIEGMTLTELKAKIQQLGQPNQYLADVETYLRDGQRRYTGLWRIGCEPSGPPCAHPETPGSLVIKPSKEFGADHTTRRKTEDLVDFEVYHEGGEWMYLGVYRPRKPNAVGVRGLQRGKTWEQLEAKDAEFKGNSHLVDIETYLDGDKRLFSGLWAPGKVDGKLFRNSNAASFAKQVDAYADSKQLVDLERYKSMQVGVWSTPGKSKGISINRTWGAFAPFVASLSATRTLIDVEEFSTLAAQVLTAVPSGFNE